MNPFHSTFTAQKKKSFELRTSIASERRQKLQRLLELIWDNEERICEATRKDFGKPAIETLMTELMLVSHEIHLAIKHLDEWMQPKKVSSGLVLLGARSEIHVEPLGTTLILAPWNYPWQLSLIPLVTAIAAGNTVILKPSEIVPNCSALLEELLTPLFRRDEVAVVLGGVSESTALLELPFDHIFFTGSTAVGKIVMAAAAKNLSKVTLELGGKSPAIIHQSADLNWTAERLVWGKWINGGQTCVAPDTLFVDRAVWPELLEKIKLASEKFAQNLAQDLSRIVSPRHFDRMKKIATEATQNGWKLVHQAGSEESTSRQWPLQFFEQTSKESAAQSLLGREEIFGPLAPVVLFDSIAEVLTTLQAQEKPLALYLFARDGEIEKRVVRESASGGVLINDVLVHLANANLPFGGVNSSGLGHYHGEFGFRTFSHEKAVVRQGSFKFLPRFFSPPYNDSKLQWGRRLARWI